MYKCFKAATLKTHNYNKGDLAKAMKLDKIKGYFDTALPHDWLKQFYNMKGAITSNLIYSTTFWVYDKKGRIAGRPISGCLEVRQFLNKLQHN